LQGAGELGLDLPDIIDAGRPFAIGITGADRTYDVFLPRYRSRHGTRGALNRQEQVTLCLYLTVSRRPMPAPKWAVRTGEEAPKACAKPLLCPPERASAVALRWLIAAR
jgi:hypothetical protein